MLHAGASPRVATTGHAVLDAELPGGGWPLDGMVELLQPPQGGAPLWPLLLPALAAHRPGRAVVLVGAPLPPGRPKAAGAPLGGSAACEAAERGGYILPPYLPALAAGGLSPQRVLWIPDASSWAAEQALRCADVAAVLAWSLHARQAELRRLHLAAAQRGDSLLFVVRPVQAAREASPAPLRLRLASDMPEPATGLVSLVVDIIKRRGPPLAAPLRLPSQPPALRALLSAGAARQRTGARVLPFAARPAARPEGARDVDRLAVAA